MNFMRMTKLTASDADTSDNFGQSVILSGDYALIGSHFDDVGVQTDQGSAYVYLRSGILWSQQAQLVASDGASNDYFGYSVSLDGDYALIGAYYDYVSGDTSRGSAYVFLREGTVWNQQAQLVASDGDVGDSFGRSVAVLGDYALILQ